MKPLYTLLLTLSTITCFAQLSDRDRDTLYFKDGQTLAGRKEIMKSCVADVAQVDKNIESYGACSCIIDVLTKNYTKAEFEELFVGKSENIIVIATSNKSAATKEIGLCILNNLIDKEDTSSLFGNSDKNTSAAFSEGFAEGFLPECEKALQAAPNINGKLYCQCVLDNIRAEGVALSRLAELQDPNSLLFNKIVIPCVGKTSVTASVDKTAVNNDVSGLNASERILLISLANVYKLKVRVGKTEKYFTLDSGASVTFINSSFEKELLKNNVITSADYLPAIKFEMANGTYEECRRVKINGLQVGGYTINNVVVAINEKPNSLLLLGKTVLDKFSHWSIDNTTNELILTR